MAKENSTKPSYGQSNDPGRFNFMGLAKVCAITSATLVILSLLVIGARGFIYGIDFAGGTEIQVQFEKEVTPSKMRDFAENMGFLNPSVQSIGEDNEFLIRISSVEAEKEEESLKQLNALIEKFTIGLKDTFAAEVPTVRRVDTVGPQVGSELKRNGILATFYSLLLILIYIGLRFDYVYAPGAVLCLFHDCIVTLGIFSLINHEVNLTTLAAILTLIGYSLNDTIITFDRIRENLTLPSMRDNTFKFIINRSINDSLSRTILTSFTTMLAVVAMYFIAGGVIQDFAFTLGLGIIIGTYSSIYVASPLVLVADHFRRQNAAKVAKAA